MEQKKEIRRDFYKVYLKETCNEEDAVFIDKRIVKDLEHFDYKQKPFHMLELEQETTPGIINLRRLNVVYNPSTHSLSKGDIERLGIDHKYYRIAL